MFTKSSNIHRLTCSFKLATIGCRFVLVCMTLETNPANICWSLRHILKTSSIRLQRNNFSSSKTSWRRLEDILEDEKLLRWRRIEDISWRRLEDMSWRRLEDLSWRHVLKMSGKRLGDKQNVFWSYLYLTNLNVYLTNLVFHKPVSDESKMNPKCIS